MKKWIKWIKEQEVGNKIYTYIPETVTKRELIAKIEKLEAVCEAAEKLLPYIDGIAIGGEVLYEKLEQALKEK